jgi:hypothetical protein
MRPAVGEIRLDEATKRTHFSRSTFLQVGRIGRWPRVGTGCREGGIDLSTLEFRQVRLGRRTHFIRVVAIRMMCPQSGWHPMVLNAWIDWLLFRENETNGEGDDAFTAAAAARLCVT